MPRYPVAEDGRSVGMQFKHGSSIITSMGDPVSSAAINEVEVVLKWRS